MANASLPNVIPAAAVGAFYAGRKFGCDDEKMKFGMGGVGLTAILGGASYGAGYLAGRMS